MSENEGHQMWGGGLFCCVVHDFIKYSLEVQEGA